MPFPRANEQSKERESNCQAENHERARQNGRDIYSRSTRERFSCRDLPWEGLWSWSDPGGQESNDGVFQSRK